MATAQTVLTNILILGLNFGTGIITAQALGPGGRGEQAAMQMWPQILASAFTLGLPSAVLYNLKRDCERARQLLSTALLMGVGMGLVATSVGVAFIPYWLNEYPPAVVRSAQWLMSVAPVILLVAVSSSVLRAREEFTAFNAVRYAQPMLTLLALAALTLTHRLTPLSAALAYLLVWAPIFLWLFLRLCKVYPPTLRGFRASSRSLSSYGIRSYGTDLLGWVAAGQIDRLLVAGLLNPTALGLYVVAISLARILDAFPAAVAQIVLPKTVDRPVEEVMALVGRSARVSACLALLVAAALALLGPLALGLLYGEGFVRAVPVFRLFLAEVVLSGIVWVLSQAFMASNRPGTVSIVQGLGVGINVLLLLVLVPRYGLVGAGLSQLVATTVRFASVLVSFPLVLRVRPPRMRPRWDDFSAIVRRERGTRG